MSKTKTGLHTGKQDRILHYLTSVNGAWVCGNLLSIIGSGRKGGSCRVRRVVSDLRAQGWKIACRVDNTRAVWRASYRLTK